MPKANNGKYLVSEIKLFKFKYIIPLSEFLNKSKNKRLYYGLIQWLRNYKN